MKTDEAIKILLDCYNENEIFRNDPNRPNISTEYSSIKNLFENYACVDFAYVVNKLKGWDLYHFEFIEDDKQDFAPYHVVAKVKESDLYFDINGFSTFDDIIKRFNANPKYVENYKIKPSVFMIKNEKDIKAISKIIIEIIEEKVE